MKELSTTEIAHVSGGIYVQLAWAVGGWIGGNMLNSILSAGDHSADYSSQVVAA